MGSGVVLVGGDHYNGLALVRLFGKLGMRPCGVIVGERAERGFLCASRYWERVTIVESDDEVPDLLIRPSDLLKYVPVNLLCHVVSSIISKIIKLHKHSNPYILS